MRRARGITIAGVLGVLGGAGAIVSTAASTTAPGTYAARNGVRECQPIYQHFHSRPDLHPVAVCIGRRAGPVASGLLMIAPKTTANSQRGPEIIDNAGNLVWMGPFDYSNDLRVMRLNGKPVLVWWDGRLGRNGHLGEYQVMDEHYRVIHEIAAGGSIDTDMHDIHFTPRGTAIVGSHPDYRDPGTGKHVMGDYVVTEVDIATGRAVFQWRARDHIPVSASYRPMPRDATTGWDAYHGNSVEFTRDGNVLISMRNTSAVYKINRRTGRIMWTLGGKRDSFDLVSRHRGWQFCHQHDARELGDGQVMVFDNGGNYADGNCPHHIARVEVFALDLRRHTARLVRQISSRTADPRGRGYVSWYVGSARRLGNHDTLVDWGSVPVIDEFDRLGRIVLDMRLGAWTYRAVRGDWVGEPLDEPAVAARRTGRTVTVWASWNGATQVASWQLLTGSAADSLTARAHPLRRTGFETQMTATGTDRFAAAEALDARGRVLGTSATITIR